MSKIVIPEYIQESFTHKLGVEGAYFDSEEFGLGAVKQRREFNETLGFPLINQEFLDAIKEEVKDKAILEVCSGSGYLSSLLKDNGANIIPTDNYSLAEKTMYRKWLSKAEENGVLRMDALEAIEKYHDQVNYVLMSWPDYNNPLAFNVAQLCAKYNLDLIYIGEWYGGCTADDDFFDFIGDYEVEDMNLLYGFRFLRFIGIYDDPYIIRFSKGKKERR